VNEGVARGGKGAFHALNDAVGRRSIANKPALITSRCDAVFGLLSASRQ
jgi:hypothetical protein